MYYRFSFGKGLVFCLQDGVNFFEVIVWERASSGGNDFIVSVSTRCGDYFLGISDSYNFSPTAIDTIVF